MCNTLTLFTPIFWMMAVCVEVLSALHWSMYFCSSFRIMLGVFCFPLLLTVGTQPSISHGFSSSSSSPFASGTEFSFRLVDAAAVAVLVSMFLVLVRAFRGPTVFDRILAINSFGTLTVLLIAVHGYLAGRPEFLDLALVYALINFVGTIAVTRFMQFQRFGSRYVGDEHHGDI